MKYGVWIRQEAERISKLPQSEQVEAIETFADTLSVKSMAFVMGVPMTAEKAASIAAGGRERANPELEAA